MSECKSYIDALKLSLKKKLALLSEIDLQNRRQRTILEGEDGSADEFHETVEEKARLIEEIDKLDEGFEEVFARVREELDQNRSLYKDDIALMQDLIRMITDKVSLIRSQESTNKDLTTKKVLSVRTERKNLNTSRSVTDKYYQNMMKINLVDPQFMDKKK